MTTEGNVNRTPVPWHFWAVAVVSLVWNSYGGYDYTMSHLSGEAYYRQMGMTEAQITYMAAYPSWMHAVWAVGVWGSVDFRILGSGGWDLRFWVEEKRPLKNFSRSIGRTVY